MEHCDIVKDLLPLCADGLASTESEELVRRHTERCPECRALLERMRAPLTGTPEPDGEAACRKALRAHRRKESRTLLLAALLALACGAALCLFLLWSRGIFCIIDRQVSPDGQVVTTAYCRDISGPFPAAGGFSVRDRGVWTGTTIYLDASFDGMWWSPDSRYLVISMVRDGGIYLEMLDYQNNAGENLDAYLDMALYGDPHFTGADFGGASGSGVEYRFLQWSEDESIMLIHYDYQDRAGNPHTGYLWYDCASACVSGVMALDEAQAD